MANIIPFRQRSGETWKSILRLFWNASLNRLSDYLTIMQKETKMPHDLKIDAPVGKPFVTITRSFNAPRALVWKALSEREHAVRWWGPHGHKNRVLAWDFRVGGKWSIESIVTDGSKIVFFGDYLEIEAPSKLTQTFSFDQLPPGAHSVDAVTLTEKDGKTIYTAVSTLPDVESRDAMVASGMEVGIVEGFERLDQMLEDWKVSA
jgi:uncharacterized protein YndB with AHSA1/START domain